jgi:hypothetical protein
MVTLSGGARSRSKLREHPAPMKEDCTPLFLRYRDVARFLWNAVFAPDPKLTETASILAFNDATARLFEAMILRPLGYDDMVQAWPHGLGAPVKFEVTLPPQPADASSETILIGKSQADVHHIWTEVIVNFSPGTYQLRFMGFFDWDVAAHREYRFLRVFIERLDQRSDFMGRHALIEVNRCSIWLSEEDEPEPVGAI